MLHLHGKVTFLIIADKIERKIPSKNTHFDLKIAADKPMHSCICFTERDGGEAHNDRKPLAVTLRHERPIARLCKN